MGAQRRACSSGPRRQTRHVPSLLGLAVVWASSCSASYQANAFAVPFAGGRPPTRLSMTNGNGESNGADEDDKMLSELVRVKLEADHTRKFLKSRPRKLAYDEARTWVQRNLGVDTQEEFNDLVENGNLRTPYIPKRPEEYYSQSNEWISWDHFLKDDRNYPGVKPASGAFD